MLHFYSGEPWKVLYNGEMFSKKIDINGIGHILYNVMSNKGIDISGISWLLYMSDKETDGTLFLVYVTTLIYLCSENIGLISMA